eukprot:scaffold22638_cov226-Skeletonema_marinoi.AAC.1
MSTRHGVRAIFLAILRWNQYGALVRRAPPWPPIKATLTVWGPEGRSNAQLNEQQMQMISAQQQQDY